MSPAIKDKPWDVYRAEPQHRLLQPGWGGDLSASELSYVVSHLQRDQRLLAWWGMKGSWAKVPEEAVKRISMWGSPEDQGHNRRLARPRRQSRPAA